MKLLQEKKTKIPPKDWELKKLEEITKQISDGTHATPKYVENGIDFYSVENVTNDDFTNVKKITLDEHKQISKRCLVEKGDILMTRIGTLGETKLIDWDVDASIYVSLALIKVKDEISKEYLYQYTKGHNFKKELLRRSLLRATPQKINIGDIKKIPILIPENIMEQQKIASILSTWDKAIELKEKLIEQKKELKKGLMQKLLTGEVRLPGFKGEWKRVKLGDIAEVYQPKTISQRELKESGYPVYGANGLIGFYDKYNHETWQILITCRGSTCGTVNKTSGKAWITGNAMVINVDKTPNVDKDFIYYICFNQNYEKIIGGSGQPQITKKALENFEVFIPLDVQEQMELASVFHLTDNEITLLEKEVMELKQQKKGLMQLLLTGKVRVKV